MAKPLCLRLASAVGMLTLAVFMVGLLPFLSVDPTVGASLTTTSSGFWVNRSLKGDRLPVVATNAKSHGSRPALRSQEQSETPPEIPLGCDAAFSPVSSPMLALVFRRCMT